MENIGIELRSLVLISGPQYEHEQILPHFNVFCMPSPPS